MPKPRKYPDFVLAKKAKGTIVISSAGKYYIYRAKSRRVPGKKYPVVEKGECLGYFDSTGFWHETARELVRVSDPLIREWGFTNHMLSIGESFLADIPQLGGKARAWEFYRNLIVCLSRNSYLKDFFPDPPKGMDELAREYHLNMRLQLERLWKVSGLEEDELAALRAIELVTFGKKTYMGKLTDYERKLVDRLGIREGIIHDTGE